MIKGKLVYILLFSILGLSCTDDNRPVLFSGNMTARFEIPSGVNNIETYYFTVRDVPTFFAQSASVAGIDTSDVKNIQSARGLLRSTFQNEDYDFVDRVSIFVISKKDPSLKKEMYYVDFVPLGTNNELRMQSSTSELLKILREETVDLEIRLNFREIRITAIPTTMEFGYTVF